MSIKLQKTSLLRAQIEQAQQQLVNSVQQFQHKKSLFTQAALFWEQLSWRKKIAAAVLLSLPLLIGLISQLSMLALLGLNLFVFSIVSLFLLDNHVQNHKNQMAELQSAAQHLVTPLGILFEHFEELNRQFNQELLAFQEQNQQLVIQCEQFDNEIQCLKKSNRSLDECQHDLLTAQNNVKNTISTITHTVSEQSLLLEKNQTRLEETAKAYQESQAQLTATIMELKETKARLTKDVNQAQKITKTLQTTVTLLSTIATKGEEGQKELYKKLDTLIHNHEAQFDTLAKNLSEADKQFINVIKEMEANNLRVSQLLNRQETQIDRFEKPQKTITEQQQARQKLSFYPKPIYSSFTNLEQHSNHALLSA